MANFWDSWIPQPTQPAPQPINEYSNINNWEYITPARNPEASPLVTDPIYASYPSGWGVSTTPTTPNYYVTSKTPSGTSPRYVASSNNNQRFPTTSTSSSTSGSSGTDPALIAYYREKMASDAAAAAAQLAWDREQWAQEMQQKKEERLATLAAQPKSWLEYASLQGKQPVIQPWMLPLMKGNYGITSAGQPIPGYNQQDMSGMPALIPPSQQYLARVGPTANQQLYGYEQARTGANEDETRWRQWNMAPPGAGSYRGLQQVR